MEIPQKAKKKTKKKQKKTNKLGRPRKILQ